MKKLLISSLLALLLAACSGDDNLAPLSIPEGCNPIASEWDCMLPFPSDFFLVNDTSMPSGKRLAITDQAIVRTKNNLPADPSRVNKMDGFSHINQIIVLFPGGVDTAASNVVFHTGDIDASTTATSPTTLLEAATGAAVPHFAEIDPRAAADAGRAFLIRPLVRLKNKTRYIVAVHGLLDKLGQPIAPPEAFRRIREKLTAGDPILAPLAEHYESEIFPALATFGLDRKNLELAWDFTTGSEENLTADMLRVRELTIAAFANTAPVVTITKVQDFNVNSDPYLARRIDGTMKVPLFLESADIGAMLTRNAGGQVIQNGEVDVPFLILIPRSVVDPANTQPARLMQFGHGFFGGFFHGQASGIGEVAMFEKHLDSMKMVFAATDFWGMTFPDVADVMTAISSEPSRVIAFNERVHQGMANNLALSFALRGSLLDKPELGLGPTPLYDKDQLYFYGVSQGHILGATFASLSPHIDRVALSVGGCAFSFITFRARPFQAFLDLLNGAFPDELAVQKFMVLSQLAFDRIDPITYAPHLLSNTYAGSPAERRVLIQMGIGDAQVPNLATHLHARVLGLPLLKPTPREVWDLTQVDAPHDGSAITERDFGIQEPLPGTFATPAAQGNNVHNDVRQLDTANEQIDRFFRPGGLIEATCDGVCDPE